LNRIHSAIPGQSVMDLLQGTLTLKHPMIDTATEAICAAD
jgi:hypothetical protein